MTHPHEPQALAVVDRDLCFGFRYCAEILPSVFVIDETGRATVRAGSADPAALAAAVEACPRSAISFAEGGAAQRLNVSQR